MYVALSRFTSIDGLYFANDRDDFLFYHGKRGRGTNGGTKKHVRVPAEGNTFATHAKDAGKRVLQARSRARN